MDLDDCLVHYVPDPMTGQMGILPTEGAIEAVTQLQMEGNRLTVFTARLAPMPAANRQQFKDDIETTLVSMGFPPVEIWTGFSKPAADIFIGGNNVTFDGDWGLVLAQSQMMLEERGLVPPPMGDPSAYEMGPGDGIPEEAPGATAEPEAEEPKPKVKEKKPAAKKGKKNE